MADKEFEGMLGGVLDSFSTLTKGDTAVLAPLDSVEVDLNKVIDDHIYGLLSLDELAPQQVALLAALLNKRN